MLRAALPLLGLLLPTATSSPTAAAACDPWLLGINVELPVVQAEYRQKDCDDGHTLWGEKTLDAWVGRRDHVASASIGHAGSQEWSGPTSHGWAAACVGAQGAGPCAVLTSWYDEAGWWRSTCEGFTGVGVSGPVGPVVANEWLGIEEQGDRTFSRTLTDDAVISIFRTPLP